MTIRNGDVFRHVLAGGAGWGDPLERDPRAVLKDVRNELLSPAKAAADYGVIVDTAALGRGRGGDPAGGAPRSPSAAAGASPRRVQRQDPLPIKPAAE